MGKQLPPAGIRVILATLWTPPTKSDPFGKMDLQAIATQARRMYDSGHRVFISTAGSGSGFDISIEQVVVAARAVSEALSDKADAWIYVGCVAGLEQCLEVAEPNVGDGGRRQAPAKQADREREENGEHREHGDDD